ncbi:hypothetical protein NIES4106_61100 (plasmid) [Fischerella sp. NIES-4106]|nr:hypothetical protein NIES4106_61100 [Fischerella sp. NIES-4106]
MATTITVNQASEQLGLEESQFRALLEPLYKNADTIKRISMKSFKQIAETLQEKALEQELNQDVDVDAIEAQATEQPTLLQDEQTDVDNTTDIDTDKVVEEEEQSALSTLPQQEIELKVRQVLDTNINLTNQVFDLAKITKTLAVLAADKTTEQFRSIYTARLNQGIDDFLAEFSQSAIASIEQLRGQKTEDFFKELQTNYSRSNVKENLEKLASYTV